MSDFEEHKKTLFKVHDETYKALNDLAVFGTAIIKTSEDGIKHIPFQDFVNDKEVAESRGFAKAIELLRSEAGDRITYHSGRLKSVANWLEQNNPYKEGK